MATTTILLCSDSAIKAKAAKRFFTCIFGAEKFELTLRNCSGCGLPEQPIHDGKSNGFSFAKERMNFALANAESRKYDYVVSIENAISIGWQDEQDIAFVLIFCKGVLAPGRSFGFPIPDGTLTQLQGESMISHFRVPVNGKEGICGFDKTIGEVLHAANPSVKPKNWVKSTAGVSRSKQLIDGLGEDGDVTPLHDEIEPMSPPAGWYRNADLADTDLYRSGERVRVIAVDEIGIGTFLAVPMFSGGRTRKVLSPAATVSRP